MKSAAIILAGGQGTRLGFSHPKQFALLGGRPLIDYSVEKFVALRVNIIVAVLVDDYQKYYQLHPAISTVAPAGKTRQESVYNGLKACPNDTEIVFIHDSARPFFPLKNVEEGLKLIEKNEFDGLAPVIPSTDTLVEAWGRQVISFPDRQKIFRTQTPQIFIFQKIFQAYENLKENLKDCPFTDDLSLAQAAGLRCGLIEGSQMNFKITTEVDWHLAEELLSSGGLEFI
ncbi:MAG: 2-C-methyl-D-erythritol 4-phosphate cytidylyltransferase [Candidatus Aminicenantes bacterium]|nr:2-C-methyl-D-erythritol 4-phosphate cytidylyltransferase [Candidatus Aminicenantes bacterium]